jgi:hypothetical protein
VLAGVVLIRFLALDDSDIGTRRPRDPRRLASLVWATEPGLVSARLARPEFRWGALDGMVTEAVSGLMGFDYEDAGTAA